MNRPISQSSSIRDFLAKAPDRASRFLWSAKNSVSFKDALLGTSLGGRILELAGQSIVLAVHDQLAAEPTMLRWARPWWGVIGGVALSGGRRRRISKRMRRYVIACAELVPRLEPEEMAIVRVSGRLPEWFFPALRRQSRPWRRRNR